jgi:hypothetical protein
MTEKRGSKVRFWAKNEKNERIFMKMIMILTDNTKCITRCSVRNAKYSVSSLHIDENGSQSTIDFHFKSWAMGHPN